MLNFGFRKKQGMTLLELLIVIAIIGIMVAIVGGDLRAARRRSLLENETQKVIGLLEEARTLSVAAKEGRSYGVEVTGSGCGYTLFSLDDAATPTVVKSETLLHSMEFQGASEVSFEKLTGTANASTSIVVDDQRSKYLIRINVTPSEIKKGNIEVEEDED